MKIQKSRKVFGVSAGVIMALVGAMIAAMYIAAAPVGAVAPAAGDVRFWTEITGSDKDGFDLFAANPDEEARNCKATVNLTMGDGSSKSFTYEKVVRKTDKMSFGGEAGLKPAPIKDISISSSGCQQ